MNYNKFVRNLIFLTPLVVLAVIIPVGTLSAIDSVLLLSPHQVLAQESDITPEPGGEQIIQQGIATSSPDPLPGHEAHESITILRLKDDNAVYSGRITFTTTEPVEVQILHRDMSGSAAVESGSVPNIPDKFGKLAMLALPGGNGQVTITNVVPKFTEGATGTTFAASVPFSGNAVALHNLEGNPFAATYTATADVLGPAERADDIEEESTELESTELESTEIP